MISRTLLFHNSIVQLKPVCDPEVKSIAKTKTHDQPYFHDPNFNILDFVQDIPAG